MGPARGYWRWLREGLWLTRGGRIVFTVVLVLGLVGTVGDTVSGEPEIAGALGVLVGLTLGAVVGLDAAFRGLRAVAWRRTKPS